MKRLFSDTIMQWRVAVVLGGFIFVGFAIFSLALYERMTHIGRQSIIVSTENSVLFSPGLLDEMETFLRKRSDIDLSL